MPVTPSPAEGASAPRGGTLLLLGVTLLSWVGLLIALVLSYRYAHPTSSGFCGAGSDCDRVLSSRFAEVAGVPLAWLGVGLYGTLVVAFLAVFALGGGAFGLGGGRAPRRVLRGAGVVALLGTLASGVLLYLQIGVIRFVCPLCTVSAFLVGTIYVLAGRLTAGAPARPRYVPASLVGIGLIVSTLLLATLFVLGQRREIVARIDGEEITAEQLRREMQFTLYGLETQGYQVRKTWIDHKVADRILAAEAKRRGLTLEALVAAEVGEPALVTDAQIDAWLAKRQPVLPEQEKRDRVRRAIQIQARDERMQHLVETAKAQHQVEILLPAPAAPTIVIDTSLAQHEGPAGAPVRLVVFSDFECPYCSVLAGTLRRVREKFPEEVSLDYLHAPLESHERAEPAAIAAECAGLQGKFWPFHDLVFANPTALDDASLLAHAKALGLDAARFEACQHAPEARARVRANQQQAQGLGISSMPSLFLNGRNIGGAVEYIDLVRMVEEQIQSPWPAGKGR